MAMDLGTETAIVTMQERTWRVEIFCEKGDDPTLRAHREVVSIDANGKVISQDRKITMVNRRLSAMAAQSFTVGGKSYSGAEIAAVIAAVADALRQEDIAAAASAAAAKAAAAAAAQAAADAAAAAQNAPNP